MTIEPKLIAGGQHSDERGILSFINDFELNEIRRLYTIEHSNTQTVRAWQGHRFEQKWLLVVQGSFKVVLVKPDNWENPNEELPPIVFLLSANKFEILYIPGGYANGFKALEPHSKMILFSDFTVEQSSNDDYRFDQSKWFNWNIL